MIERNQMKPQTEPQAQLSDTSAHPRSTSQNSTPTETTFPSWADRDRLRKIVLDGNWSQLSDADRTRQIAYSYAHNLVIHHRTETEADPGGRWRNTAMIDQAIELYRSKFTPRTSPQTPWTEPTEADKVAIGKLLDQLGRQYGARGSSRSRPRT